MPVLMFTHQRAFIHRCFTAVFVDPGDTRGRNTWMPVDTFTGFGTPVRLLWSSAFTPDLEKLQPVTFGLFEVVYQLVVFIFWFLKFAARLLV